MKDQEILELLRSKREGKALKKLYKNFPSIQKLVLSKGGTKEDAQDVFQEALIVFCTKAERTNFKLNASIQTYLYGTSRFIFNNQLRKNKHSTSLEFDELSSNEAQELEEFLKKEAKIKQIETVLDQLGKRCWSILKLFYFDGKKMEEIAKKLEFSSEKIAKNQKYKCMERAKLKIKKLNNNR